MIWPDDYINKVIQGDCLEVLKLIPDRSVNLLITDPPYDLDIHRGSGLGGRDNVNVFRAINSNFGNGLNPLPFLEEVKRCIRPFNAYCWCSKRQISKYLNWLLNDGWNYNVLTWHKNNPIPFTHSGYMSDTEYCIFMRESGAHWTNGLDKKHYSQYWVLPRQMGIPHPTPKPIEIMKAHIKVSSEPGDIILDPFCGSGTTLVAAKQLGRRYIGIEINPVFCSVAEERLQQEELF